jgi:hypothetical protein
VLESKSSKGRNSQATEINDLIIRNVISLGATADAAAVLNCKQKVFQADPSMPQPSPNQQRACSNQTHSPPTMRFLQANWQF